MSPPIVFEEIGTWERLFVAVGAAMLVLGLGCVGLAVLLPEPYDVGRGEEVLLDDTDTGTRPEPCADALPGEAC